MCGIRKEQFANTEVIKIRYFSVQESVMCSSRDLWLSCLLYTFEKIMTSGNTRVMHMKGATNQICCTILFIWTTLTEEKNNDKLIPSKLKTAKSELN